MSENSGGGVMPTDNGERSKRGEVNFWNSVHAIWSWRTFVLAVTACVAILAVIVTLLIANWYQATSRVLLPESTSRGAFTAMLGRGDLSSLASSLLESPRGNYMRYMAIMSSRTVMEKVVDEFNLIDVYETAGKRAPREEAIRTLNQNVDFVVDRKLDYLEIQVTDRDPQRAAEMANFFVSELNRTNTRLSSQQAANYRRFVEQRYLATVADLDSARTAQQRFQEEVGLVELPIQAEVFLNSMAELRANSIQAQIEAEVLANQYGADNPRTIAARSVVDASNAEVERLYQGGDQLMPVAFHNLPAVGRRYAEVLQEVLIHQEILKFVRPMYEQALFDEQREAVAVQVLDDAVPPVRKSGPKRTIIVVAATLSAFLLAVIYVLGFSLWARNHQYVISNIRRETPQLK